MARKVIVEQYESLRAALRELRLLASESGALIGVGWKGRHGNWGYYATVAVRNRQRFYFEKPSVKRRRKRLSRRRERRFHEWRVTQEKNRKYLILKMRKQGAQAE